MLRNTRIILKQGSTLTDLSSVLANHLSGTSVINMSASDALYMGTDLPFNHRWIEASVVNAVVCTPTVSLWNGSAWIPVVDVIDETSVGGASLAQSGVLSWVPNRQNTGWINLYSTEQMSDLSTLKIYDMYWTKIQFSSGLTGTTALKYVGHKFSKDENLFSQYPDLNNSSMMTAFAAGKTNWNDQAFEAAEYIIQDLREMGVVFSSNQILDWQLFKNASVHKTAEIIFKAFGKDYEENRKMAIVDYHKSVRLKAFNVDKNFNGRLELAEKKRISDYLVR